MPTVVFYQIPPDFRLLKSNLESFLEVLKARATKYIKKIPTGNHKRPFRYLYTQAQVKEYEKEVAEKKQRTRKQSEKKPKKVTKEKPSEPKTKETVIDPITDYKLNGTKAKAFKEWFGDWEKAKQTGNLKNVSKVLNNKKEPQELSTIVSEKEGVPLEMYHGTGAEFNEFKISNYKKGTGSGYYGKGFYFTGKYSRAEGYANLDKNYQNRKGTVKSVYLNIRKPFYINSQGTNSAIKQNTEFIHSLNNDKLVSIYYETDTIDGNRIDISPVILKFGPEKFTNLLKSKGYDGVIVYNNKNKNGNKYEEVVAFEPNQIKHVDNQGTFDPNENNIYKSMQKLNLFKAQLAQRMK